MSGGTYGGTYRSTFKAQEPKRERFNVVGAGSTPMDNAGPRNGRWPYGLPLKGFLADPTDAADRRRWSALTWATASATPGPTGGAGTAGLRLWRTAMGPWWPAAQTYTSTLASTITPGAGTVVRSTSKALTGGAAPAGAAAKSTSKRAAGSAGSPSGAVAKLAAKVLAGSAGAPSGSIVRQTSKGLAGSLVPSGALAKVLTYGRNLAGSLTPTGAVVRASSKGLAGTVQPAGVAGRAASLFRSYAGAVTPGPGTLLRQAQPVKSGTITPGAGTVVRAVSAVRAGTVAPAGSPSKSTSHGTSGTAGSSGAAGKLAAKALAGSAASAGSISYTRLLARSLSSTIPSAGALVRAVLKGSSSTVPSSGAVSRSTSKRLASSITPVSTGRFVGAISISLQSTIVSAGQLARAASRRLQGSIVEDGTIRRTVAKGVSADLSPYGGSSKAASVSTGSVAALAGSPSKLVRKPLAGSVASSATVDLLKVALLALNGTLDLAGSIVRRVEAGRAGALVPDGARVRDITAPKAGALTPDGARTRAVSKGVYGTLQPLGLLTFGNPLKYLLIAAEVGLSGAARLLGLKGTSGSITPDGTRPARDVSLHRAGSVAPAGTVARSLALRLVGQVLLVGTTWVERVRQWCIRVLWSADTASVVASAASAEVDASADAASIVWAECDERETWPSVVKLHLGGSLGVEGTRS